MLVTWQSRLNDLYANFSNGDGISKRFMEGFMTAEIEIARRETADACYKSEKFRMDEMVRRNTHQVIDIINEFEQELTKEALIGKIKACLLDE